jgi:hypothetical protein
MVCGLCSVMVTEWEQLGIQGWAPLQSCGVRTEQVFMSKGTPYLHVLLLHKKL